MAKEKPNLPLAVTEFVPISFSLLHTWEMFKALVRFISCRTTYSGCGIPIWIKEFKEKMWIFLKLNMKDFCVSTSVCLTLGHWN
jgi:hypothetical protein